MVLPFGQQPWAMNALHVKHMAVNFEDVLEEAMEPVELWVHIAAAVET